MFPVCYVFVLFQLIFVSSNFCYLMFRFKVSWFYSTFKFVNHSLFTLTKLSLDVYEEPNVFDFIEIYFTCLWKLPFPINVDHTELEIGNIVLPRDWSEEPNKTLETLLFCLVYICSTRSLLPLSPGSGFTSFLLTATQPRLRTILSINLGFKGNTLSSNCSIFWGLISLDQFNHINQMIT